MTLHLFRGHPGSGKTTAAAKMFPGVVKFENDQYFMRNGSYHWSKEELPAAIHWCMDMVQSALENGMDVVVSNTFTRARFVEVYQKIAARAGANFKVYRCTGNYGNVHGLSKDKVDSFKNSMEDWPGEKTI